MRNKNMTDQLIITIDQGDDGTAGLKVKVHSGSFSGEGEAWFNISEIKLFTNQLIKFAKTTENPPSIEGGNWDGKGNLKDVLLSLRFYSFSNYRCGLQVKLSDYPQTECREEEISRVSVELKPEVSKVLLFAEQLEKLISSNNGEVILEC